MQGTLFPVAIGRAKTSVPEKSASDQSWIWGKRPGLQAVAVEMVAMKRRSWERCMVLGDLCGGLDVVGNVELARSFGSTY